MLNYAHGKHSHSLPGKCLVLYKQAPCRINIYPGDGGLM